MFKVTLIRFLPSVLILGWLSHTAGAQRSTGNSQTVASILQKARAAAEALDHDARTLVSYTHAHSEGGSRSEFDRRIAQDMSMADEIAREMLEMKRIASSAQEDAINTVTPLLHDLVHNTRAMTQYVATDPGGCHSSSCAEYIVGHEKVSQELTRQVTEATKRVANR